MAACGTEAIGKEVFDIKAFGKVERSEEVLRCRRPP
jgi:hypothetical protein